MSLFQPFDLISKEPFHRRFALRYSDHWYTVVHKSFTNPDLQAAMCLWNDSSEARTADTQH